MKKNIACLSTALAALAAFSFVSASSGCGVSAASLCNDICTCARCTENDLNTCKDDADAAEDKASELGCSSEFGDYVACMKETISCNGDKAEVIGCEAEQATLNKCAGGIVFGDPCKLATDKIESCLEIGGGGEDGEGVCEGASLCAAQCIVAASCAELQDAFGGSPSETGQAVINCFTGCSDSSGSSGGSSGGPSPGRPPEPDTGDEEAGGSGG